MENRVGKSHSVEIPKKSRSLDLRSLYESNKTLKEDRNNKRKGGGVAAAADGKGREKKKSRKEVSISSFKNASSSSSYSKSLEEVYNGSLSSGLKDSKSGLSERLIDSNGFKSVSLALKDGVLKVPRRKRGHVGRRKVENGSQVAGLSSGKVGNAVQVDKLIAEEEGKWFENGRRSLKPAGISSCKVGDTDLGCKFTGDDKVKQAESLNVKLKKGSDNFKENRNGELNAVRHSNEEDRLGGHLVEKKCESSSKKSHDDPLLQNNSASSMKKSLRKRSRKKKDSMSDRKIIKDADPSVDTSVKVSDVLQDDDEENLEENAARMLSSRFDPSCTVFSSNSKATASPSKNGSAFPLSSGQEFIARGSGYVSGSESASVDTACRLLRPRKQNKEKGTSRKRRHYYEVFCGDLDANWVLNRRIKVFWPLDQSWYYGLVGDYDKERKLHHVKYDDRDEEWINLQNERFKLLLLPSEVPGKTRRKRPLSRDKRRDEKKGKQMSSKEKKKDLTAEDDSYEGAYMDSEPIISWLARSSHRVKSSPIHALKKQKTSVLSSTCETPLLHKVVNRLEYLDGGALNRDKDRLSGNSASSETLAIAGRSDLSVMESPVCSTDSKLPIVYYRRRYRKTSSVLCHTSKGDHISANPDEVLEKFDAANPLWLTDNPGQLKLNFSLIESRCFRFKLSFPLPSVPNYSFGKENIWLFNALLLLRYGMLITTWPRVHLEMLFVDNMVGLRFLLFEGCLKQAVAFVFLVLTLFRQPNEQGECPDSQLPITSIRFKVSCIQDLRKQLVFAFYNFFEVEDSKWMDLDHKLKPHCLLSGQLPLAECTYDNIKALQSGTNCLLSPLDCSDSTLNKVLLHVYSYMFLKLTCGFHFCFRISLEKKFLNRMLVPTPLSIYLYLCLPMSSLNIIHDCSIFLSSFLNYFFLTYCFDYCDC